MSSNQLNKMDPISIAAIVIFSVAGVILVVGKIYFRVWNTNISYDIERGIGIDPQYVLPRRDGYKPRSWWKIFFTA